MSALVHEKVWVDKKVYDDAERQFYESRAKLHCSGSPEHLVPPDLPVPVVPRVSSSSLKKQKQKNMPPVQSVGNVTNAPASPKKSKKNKKDKAKKSVAEKEQRSSSEREKEVSVEKIVERSQEKESGRQSTESCPTKVCKVKEGSDKHKDIPNKCGDSSDKNKHNIDNKSKENAEKSKDNADKSKDNADKSKDNADKSKDHNSKKNIKREKSAEVVQNDSNKLRDLSKGGASDPSGQCSLASEVAKARQHIKNSLECMDSVAALAGVPNVDVLNKINSLEKENQDLKKSVEELRRTLQDLKTNFDSFASKFSGAPNPVPAVKAAPAPAPKEDSDDGVDLFGSDDEEETAEAARVREERLAAYNAKKSNKPVLIAKSNIILDVKPWDDETDMKAMETAVRSVTTDGLLWGAAKLVPLAYGIHKLQISCVVEDDKVSIDWLQEELEKLEDFVQSVDIAAFNKV